MNISRQARRNALEKERRKDPMVRAAQNESVQKRRRKRLRLLNLLKMERPCYDCGGMFPPEVTDWDHLPGTKKSFALSKGVSHSIEAAIDEINKCQLVCSNCHRIRTGSRKQ